MRTVGRLIFVVIAVAPLAFTHAQSLRVLDVQVNPAGEVSLRWLGLGSNYLYSVESCASLAGAQWALLTPDLRWPTSETNWTGILASQTHAQFFRIRAQRIDTMLAAPNIVDAFASEGGFSVAWDPLPGASSYEIFWASDLATPPERWTQIRGAVSPFTDVGPEPGTSRYYRLRARGVSGEGFLSQPIRVGPPSALQPIVEATASLKRYSFRVERSQGLWYSGQIDLNADRQYVQVGLMPAEPGIVEFVSQGTNGFARRLGTTGWLPVRSDRFARYLQTALALLQNASVVATREDPANWWVDLKATDLPMKRNPTEFWTPIVERLGCSGRSNCLALLVERSLALEVTYHFSISREDSLIREFTIEGRVNQERWQIRTTFAASQAEIPSDPPGPWDPDAVHCPPEVLLLPIKTLGGWGAQKNHAPWAQRSIELIEERDATNGFYAEIYSTNWPHVKFTGSAAPDSTQHHPIVLGAYDEDSTVMPTFYADWFGSDPDWKSNQYYYWDSSAYSRDYHHYGTGQGVGLQYEWFFKIRELYDSSAPTPATTAANNRYYDARDWAYGAPRTTAKVNV